MGEQIFASMSSELSETSNPTSPFLTADRILAIAGRTLQEQGCEAYPAIRVAVDMAFEKFVRPIDLPYVDGVVETTIESGLKTLLLKACDELHAWICPVVLPA